MEQKCGKTNDVHPSESDYYPASKVISDLREVYNLTAPFETPIHERMNKFLSVVAHNLGE